MENQANNQQPRCTKCRSALTNWDTSTDSGGGGGGEVQLPSNGVQWSWNGVQAKWRKKGCEGWWRVL